MVGEILQQDLQMYAAKIMICSAHLGTGVQAYLLGTAY